MSAICRRSMQTVSSGCRGDQNGRYAWTRQCPACGRVLQKMDPM